MRTTPLADFRQLVSPHFQSREGIQASELSPYLEPTQRCIEWPDSGRSWFAIGIPNPDSRPISVALVGLRSIKLSMLPLTGLDHFDAYVPADGWTRCDKQQTVGSRTASCLRLYEYPYESVKHSSFSPTHQQTCGSQQGKPTSHWHLPA